MSLVTNISPEEAMDFLLRVVLSSEELKQLANRCEELGNESGNEKSATVCRLLAFIMRFEVSERETLTFSLVEDEEGNPSFKKNQGTKQ